MNLNLKRYIADSHYWYPERVCNNNFNDPSYMQGRQSPIQNGNLEGFFLSDQYYQRVLSDQYYEGFLSDRYYEGFLSDQYYEGFFYLINIMKGFLSDQYYEGFLSDQYYEGFGRFNSDHSNIFSCSGCRATFVEIHNWK